MSGREAFQATEFSLDSNALPPHLAERDRLSLFRELFARNSCLADISYAPTPDRPFFFRWKFVPVGDVNISDFEGTLHQVTRTARHVAEDQARQDTYFFYLNVGRHPSRVARFGRELLVSDAPALMNGVKSASFSADGQVALLALRLPRHRILARVPQADDLVLAPMRPGSEVLFHLKRYLRFLTAGSGSYDDPALADHVDATLIDLVALVLGAAGDSAELARGRGLRAARLRSVAAEIEAGFSDPAFSSARVGLKLGLSQRYVNDLLQESGKSFAERVLELRLEKAHATLSSSAFDHLKVTEIALRCGFNDLSYFNRCFRRRYGATPSDVRCDISATHRENS